MPELCRDCRFKALLAQAPTNHDDILEDEADKRMRLGVIGEINEDGGDCERVGLLGQGKGRRKSQKEVEMRVRRKGWMGRFW